MSEDVEVEQARLVRLVSKYPELAASLVPGGTLDRLRPRAIAHADYIAPVSISDAPPSEIPAAATTNLIVEFVVPHYFASLFASQYPDEHGGFGAQVFFHDTHDHPVSVVGDVTFIENASGDWLIDIRYEEDVNPRHLRTHIESVSRIVVV